MRYLIALSFLIGTVCHSQTRDAILWGGVGLKANIGKKWSVKYETQTRFYKNVSTLSSYYNELSADYKLSKYLAVGANYRYSRKNREDYFTGENRFCANVKFDTKLTDTGIKFKSRLRYQYSFDRLSVINDDIYPTIRNTIRWKFELAFKNDNFKRVAPFIGSELFKRLDPNENQGLSARRLYGGIDFDLPDRHEIGIKYIYELEQGAPWRAEHIYAIQYNYKLSSRLFKKKKED